MIRLNYKHVSTTHFPVLTLAACFLFFFLWHASIWAATADLDSLKSVVGSRDAILVADPKDKVILSKNIDNQLIPASILKILTSRAAIHYLGINHRFVTDFYTDQQDNLKIRGSGDPLLISEIISEIARQLAVKLTRINNIVVDDSLFVQPLEIPGVSNTTEPYDAPNGALCVNFNTVNFKTVNGVIVSAEPQTPLLPLALDRIKRSKLSRGRIVLSHSENECTLYAGHLFGHFLNKEGLNAAGKIILGKVQPETDRLIYQHVSPYTLDQIVSKLLVHSNNYTTNQLLITTGIAVYGPPGTLPKGVRALTAYAKEVLGLTSLSVTEGSGISRQNRLSARDMHKVLVGFKPYRHLMRLEGRQYYKTGTLNGINTRAGYLQHADDGIYSFVVICNTPGRSARRIVQKLIRILDE